MNSGYTQQQTRKRHIAGALALGMLVTLLLVLAVPIANSLSFTRDDDKNLRTLEATLQAPPPPPSQPPPPPEKEKPDEKPELEQKPPPLTLAQLDVALSPGTGVASGDFGMGGYLGQFDALDQIQVFELNELDRQPLPIQRVAPQHPYDMKRAGIDGWVQIVFVIDEKGLVLAPRVEKSSQREFEQAALDAIRMWRFDPGYKDGRPVRTKARQLLVMKPGAD